MESGGEKEILLSNYQSFESLKAVIKSISGDTVKESEVAKTEENALQFIKEYGSAAPVEIQTAFDFTNSEINEVIESLVDKNSIRRVPAGNGYFVEPFNGSMAYDANKGICSI